MFKPPEVTPEFVRFWQFTYDKARRIPLRVERRPVKSPDPQFKMYEVEFDSWDGVRIGGWITVPAKGRFERGLVVGHGYGGRSAPEFDLPPPAAATIFPCARGFNRSASREIPGEANRHVLHGIENRETYVHRGCAADLWAAASALIELYPETARRLDYFGSSFGGGIGALALPWDNRFHRAFLDVPSFGLHTIRLDCPCVGSGEAVRTYFKTHPEVREVLNYYDAGMAARLIKIPVMVAAAVFDPAVPPPGQFAVYNGLSGPKELFVKRAAHFAYPDEAAERATMYARLWSWWS